MKEKKIYVRIDNAFAEARYDYTEAELNLLFFLMFKIHKDTLTYQFSLNEIREVTGKDKKGSHVYETFRSLYGRAYTVGDPEGDWVLRSLFREVSCTKGIIRVEIDEKLLQLLCDLKEKYTLMDLSGGFKLDGKYSKRFFLLMSRWKNAGYKRYDIEELKEILRYDACEKSSFTRFRNLIEGIIEDVNSITDIRIKAEWEKTGKRYTDVKFTITKNRFMKEISFKDSEDLVRLKRLLYAAELSTEQVERLHNEGCDYSKAKKIYDRAVASLMDRDVAVRNPAAYLLSCFRDEGYLLPDRSEKMQEKIRLYRELVESGTPLETLTGILAIEGIAMEDLVPKGNR